MSWEQHAKNVEKGPVKTVLTVMFLLCVLGVPLFLFFGGTNYLKERYYNPEIQSARRVAFEATRSYQVGNREELARLKLEYNLSTPDKQEILKEYILKQFTEMDKSDLPEDLSTFLTELENN